MTRPRRLPWVEGDRRTYVISDKGGVLDRIADEAEVRLLDNARSLLKITGPMLDELRTQDEWKFTCERLRESLTDAVNLAEARGERLCERS
ncbi:hypothetical protein O7599_03305 [Streptomyces sp. WMMC500]|uniref:hypothetical protein n=1 Tax=Streptomyces sp. WMMC500 TaxID=3015154 RepID=UPI00248CA5E1|nr:hypothetical protein [Streptomyces sp. WMMC500]WBB61598.1 hypothetical protein O7599_03305 [Streptomyces sp. WMMC500]